MAKLLKGDAVVAKINEDMVARVSALKEEGVVPTLAILRVGNEGDQISYETGATKKAEALGLGIRSLTFDATATQGEIEDAISSLNADDEVHGIMLLLPLPSHLDEEEILNAIAAEKDVDGASIKSMAGVYAGKDMGFPPCTPEACIEILDFYGIDLSGKNVAVIGRSLVVGKPLAMMLLKRNATVTICHSKTEDIKEAAWNSDILVSAIGSPRALGRDFVRENQIVIDVGINVDEEGKLVGDVDFDAVVDAAGAITPVPGGVGMVTTSVLFRHVVEAAEKGI